MACQSASPPPLPSHPRSPPPAETAKGAAVARNPELVAAIRAAVGGNTARAEAPAPEELVPLPPLTRSEDGASPETTDRAARVPPETVQRVVRQSAGKFRNCYHAALGRAPSLAGRIAVELLIGRDGRVRRVKDIEPAVPDRRLRSCVQARFFELEFPSAPADGLRVRYSLVFSRNGNAPLATLGDARRTAEPPPPGFAEALRTGRPVAPALPDEAPPAPPAPAPSAACDHDDPMCDAL